MEIRGYQCCSLGCYPASIDYDSEDDTDVTDTS